MPNDYISREAFAEYLREMIATSADVVEVVRCKDCKHRIKRAFYANVVYCGRAGMKVMALNDFCSKGEKGR